MIRRGLALFTLLASSSVAAQSIPATHPRLRDSFSDTWTATDAVGRALPGAGQVGAPRPDRFVGMFYFLWQDSSEKDGPFDVSKILANDPAALSKDTSPPWGPLTRFHHWGEPLFGYYLADDEWVIRKHAQMLGDAGVDVIIFDTSNKLTYKHNYMTLLRVFHQLREEGNKTPQVAFLTPFWDPKSTVTQLYNELYSRNLYEDLWFRWDSKPLILADPDKVDPVVRNFFTFRAPQPDYFQGPTRSDQWSWLEVYPQHMFKNAKGENEEMCVGVAQNAVGNRLGSMSEHGSRGRSFHAGQMDLSPNATLNGFNFAEQFERALEADPQFVFITGWNEWIAGRWPEFNQIKGNMFVDEYDPEHSRDIEPMKGGHGDNYYYQLVSFIRRYKGVRSMPAASPPRTIDIGGDFSQWNTVGPEFIDDVNDTIHRDHPGYANVGRYTNTTGRNDLVLMKVTRDAANIYFYAQTKAANSPSSDPNWMTLFINSDCDAVTGWHGYDWLVNRKMTGANQSTLEGTKTGWNWKPRSVVHFKVSGNQLMLAIPRIALGLADSDKPVRFEFKWADNFQENDNIDAFTLYGDAAPPGRFNYFYGISTR
jgi:hypothetical protein